MVEKTHSGMVNVHYVNMISRKLFTNSGDPTLGPISFTTKSNVTNLRRYMYVNSVNKFIAKVRELNLLIPEMTIRNTGQC